MENLTIKKNDFRALINEKIENSDHNSRTLAVVRKGSRFAYNDIKDAEEIEFDYDVSILPPKKYFQPPKEVLLRFVPGKADSYVAVESRTYLTLIGVHYYDLAAIYLMDKAFSTGEKDTNYIRRRENSLLIGMYPTKTFKYRFSRSVVKNQHYKVADLMLVSLNDDFVIEVVSEKGKDYLKDYIEKGKIKKSTYSLQEINDAKVLVKDRQKLPIAPELTGDFLNKNYDHPVWQHFGEKCFSCGSCVLVCPTCYCFDVNEEIELTLSEGKRIRNWDGCMLEDFALVADGHNFRRSAAERFRHRVFRKGKHLPDRFSSFGCVGCGRCADQCTASIAGPVKIIQHIQQIEQVN